MKVAIDLRTDLERHIQSKIDGFNLKIADLSGKVEAANILYNQWHSKSWLYRVRNPFNEDSYEWVSRRELDGLKSAKNHLKHLLSKVRCVSIHRSAKYILEDYDLYILQL